MTPLATRRQLLSSALLLLLGACRRHTIAPAAPGFELSMRFAERELAYAHAPTEALRRELLADPSLAAIARHREMAGRAPVTLDEILDELLAAIDSSRDGSAKAALDSWRTLADECPELIAHAAAFLPPDTPLQGRVYIVIGYEMAAASPPDILVDAAHPRFAEPGQLRYLLVHETHHLGFLRWRSWPKLDRLFEGSIAELVRFSTHMEGMAVHAARPLREAERALAGDPDYAIYTNPELRAPLVEAFGELWRECQVLLPAARAVEILERMSGGERLWYRFGALVCETIERERGRAALISTIRQPARFWAAAERLIEKG